MFDDDVIPVDPSGFDEDAWMAWLAAEHTRVPSPAERVERVISIRAGMARLAAMEARELAALADGIDEGKTSGSGKDTCDRDYRSLATELMLTGQPSGDPDAPHAASVGFSAEIAVVIPMLTLLGKGDGDEPAAIVGTGPIDLTTARNLAGFTTTVWTRILTDPVTDQILATNDYRPPEKLRRYVRFRDGRCRFPTCNRSAWRCDIDHTDEWHDGGTTSHDNLALLCRYHHALKGNTPWKVVQTSPGVLEWTSPLGRVITDVPDRPVRFS
ncbi:MAG: HNH endonuclease [Cryobacterium sp.]|nr:HNH endonuclease [Cryobacterium sp.]HNP15811.1 HNH endonuclease signature motif containing protein [Terrimesophilobacter sp.]